MNQYYYEPDAFQLDPSILRSVLYNDAIDINKVELFEKTEVDGILTDGNKIVSCTTNITVNLTLKILLMLLEHGALNYFLK